MKESDRTAYIFLPGGLGTLDEVGWMRSAGSGSRLWQPAAPLVHWPANRSTPCCGRCTAAASQVQPWSLLSYLSSRWLLALSLAQFFEILTLVQLRKLGTKFPVPIILVDYDGFYAGLLQVRGGVLATCLCTGWLCGVLTLQSCVQASRQH